MTTNGMTKEELLTMLAIQRLAKLVAKLTDSVDKMAEALVALAEASKEAGK